MRASVVGQWRSAAASLHRCHRVLALFPWLKSWAHAGMRRKADRVTLLQQQAGRLMCRDALVAAAGVTALDSPGLPTDDPVFAPLGTPAAVSAQLASLWRRWSRRAADSWEHPGEHDHLAYDLVRGISSRRKGHQEALEHAEELLASWSRSGGRGR